MNYLKLSPKTDYLERENDVLRLVFRKIDKNGDVVVSKHIVHFYYSSFKYIYYVIINNQKFYIPDSFIKNI